MLSSCMILFRPVYSHSKSSPHQMSNNRSIICLSNNAAKYSGQGETGLMLLIEFKAKNCIVHILLVKQYCHKPHLPSALKLRRNNNKLVAENCYCYKLLTFKQLM